MVDPARALVALLKPQFAEAIVDGSKTVEVRRIMPDVTVTTLAPLHASGSAQAPVGTWMV